MGAGWVLPSAHPGWVQGSCSFQPLASCDYSGPSVCSSCHLPPVSSFPGTSIQVSMLSLSPRDKDPVSLAVPEALSHPPQFLIASLLLLMPFSRHYTGVCDLPPPCMPLRILDGPPVKRPRSFIPSLTHSLPPSCPAPIPTLPPSFS